MRGYTLISDTDSDGLASARIVIDSEGMPEELILSREPQVVNNVAERLHGKDIVVCDKSTHSNASGLETLIQNRNRITWIDHHASLKSLSDQNTTFYINERPDYCAARIAYELTCNGKEWAAVGLLGDLRTKVAEEASKSIGVTSITDCDKLARLINMNNREPKGNTLNLYSSEHLLYKMLRRSPSEVLNLEEFRVLNHEYKKAMENLSGFNVKPRLLSNGIYILELPKEAMGLYWDISKDFFEEMVKSVGKTLITYVDGRESGTVMDAVNAAPIAEKLGGGGRQFAGGFKFKGDLPAFEKHIRTALATLL